MEIKQQIFALHAQTNQLHEQLKGKIGEKSATIFTYLRWQTIVRIEDRICDLISSNIFLNEDFQSQLSRIKNKFQSFVTVIDHSCTQDEQIAEVHLNLLQKVRKTAQQIYALSLTDTFTEFLEPMILEDSMEEDDDPMQGYATMIRVETSSLIKESFPKTFKAFIHLIEEVLSGEYGKTFKKKMKQLSSEILEPYTLLRWLILEQAFNSKDLDSLDCFKLDQLETFRKAEYLFEELKEELVHFKSKKKGIVGFWKTHLNKHQERCIDLLNQLLKWSQLTREDLSGLTLYLQVIVNCESLNSSFPNSLSAKLCRQTKNFEEALNYAFLIEESHEKNQELVSLAEDALLKNLDLALRALRLIDDHVLKEQSIIEIASQYRLSNVSICQELIKILQLDSAILKQKAYHYFSLGHLAYASTLLSMNSSGDFNEYYTIFKNLYIDKLHQYADSIKKQIFIEWIIINDSLNYTTTDIKAFFKNTLYLLNGLSSLEDQKEVLDYLILVLLKNDENLIFFCLDVMSTEFAFWKKDALKTLASQLSSISSQKELFRHIVPLQEQLYLLGCFFSNCERDLLLTFTNEFISLFAKDYHTLVIHELIVTLIRHHPYWISRYVQEVSLNKFSFEKDVLAFTFPYLIVYDEEFANKCVDNFINSEMKIPILFKIIDYQLSSISYLCTTEKHCLLLNKIIFKLTNVPIPYEKDAYTQWYFALLTTLYTIEQSKELTSSLKKVINESIYYNHFSANENLLNDLIHWSAESLMKNYVKTCLENYFNPIAQAAIV